jgi:hypothetical protein
MTTRESKRIWRHRQTAIQSFIRTVENSAERSGPESGILQRIIRGYRREWARYNQLIHAHDRCRLHT